MAATTDTTDKRGAGGVRIFKIKKTFAADENVPKVLQKYDAAWLKIIPGEGETDADISPQILIEKNGVPQVTGPTSGAGIDVYPGDSVNDGDLKFSGGLADGDVLAITYGPVRYAESASS